MRGVTRVPGDAGARRPRPRRRSAGQAPRWQAEDVLAISDSTDSDDWSPGEEEDEVAMADTETEANYMGLTDRAFTCCCLHFILYMQLLIAVCNCDCTVSHQLLADDWKSFWQGHSIMDTFVQVCMKGYLRCGVTSCPRVQNMPAAEGEADGRVQMGLSFAMEEDGRLIISRAPPGLISSGPSQSETSEDESETEPVVHLYNQRMRRQPVFPIQKLLQRVRNLALTSRAERSTTARTCSHCVSLALGLRPFLRSQLAQVNYTFKIIATSLAILLCRQE